MAALMKMSKNLTAVIGILLFLSTTNAVKYQQWDEIWDDSTFNLPEANIQRQKQPVEDPCNAGSLCNEESIDSNDVLYKRNMKSGFSGLTYDKLLQMDQTKQGQATGIAPYFHTSSLPLPCACGSHYRLMDLGRAYLPRYLLTAVCDVGFCGAAGSHRCRQRNYHVRVLKRKNIGVAVVNPPEREPDPVNNPSLPESLRNDWAFETFTVTVACECGP